MFKQWVKVMKRMQQVLLGFGLTFVMGAAFAQGSGGTSATDLGSLVTNVQSNVLKPVLDAIVAISYLAGAGFIVASIFKFKAHKDNPTQVAIGVPITLLLVGIGLLFFPSIVQIMMKSLGITASGSLTFNQDSITGATS